jgi:hypothetical protein
MAVVQNVIYSYFQTFTVRPLMPLPDSIHRIERPLVRERVYATLRDWIVEGALKPNEKMRDAELAVRLGVSRTPVREGSAEAGRRRAGPDRPKPMDSCLPE